MKNDGLTTFVYTTSILSILVNLTLLYRKRK